MLIIRKIKNKNERKTKENFIKNGIGDVIIKLKHFKRNI